jgi:aminobenzoyl-glutamate utilization protein B
VTTAKSFVRPSLASLEWACIILVPILVNIQRLKAETSGNGVFRRKRVTEGYGMSGKNASEIWERVETKREVFFGLSDRVWDVPELNFDEHRSCAEHLAVLEQQGFRITRNVAGMPTAIMGEAGEGGPVIAILGEYDALPGLSQIAGIAEQKPVVEGGNGHGCGHNLLGSGSLMAATAVKD